MNSFLTHSLAFALAFLIAYNLGYNDAYTFVRSRGIELKLVECPQVTK